MSISITQSIVIQRKPEDVWDFTQDYARRAAWDDTILEAEVLEAGARPRVRVRAKGGLRGIFVYKLSERPRRTSVEMVEVESALVAGGGGSWSYEPWEGGTRWTQTNSVRLKSRLAEWLLGPSLRWTMRRAARRAMAKAKIALEMDR